MIKVTAKELFDIADDVNNPDNLKIDIDYEQFTCNFSKSLREWSKQGKYYIIVGFSNYHIGLDEVEEYDIHHTEKEARMPTTRRCVRDWVISQLTCSNDAH